jgi:hypothetical protein
MFYVFFVTRDSSKGLLISIYILIGSKHDEVKLVHYCQKAGRTIEEKFYCFIFRMSCPEKKVLLLLLSLLSENC